MADGESARLSETGSFSSSRRAQEGPAEFLGRQYVGALRICAPDAVAETIAIEVSVAKDNDSISYGIAEGAANVFIVHQVAMALRAVHEELLALKVSNETFLFFEA